MKAVLRCYLHWYLITFYQQRPFFYQFINTVIINNNI